MGGRKQEGRGQTVRSKAKENTRSKDKQRRDDRKSKKGGKEERKKETSKRKRN